ncbi:hypothetical protein H0H93_016730 [Arthromyces matolae]|nr:hypothetical protein H0H93_016730 [Arthromyces matolae]
MAMDAILDPTGAADSVDRKKIGRKDIDAIVQTLFRTNNQPTSPQRIVLQTFLDHTNSDIEAMKHEIERHQLLIDPAYAPINEIRDELFTKQQDANYCSRWLSAVRLLPPDVLMRIFEHADKNHVHSPTSIHRLSHVCAAWRNAALMGRSLWNTLIVTPGVSPKFYRKDVSSLMRLWYDNAGPSQALSIHVLLIRYLPVYGEAVAHGLVTFASRMQSIDLELDHGQSNEFITGKFRTFLTLPGGQFSSLETLRFVDQSNSSESELPLITVFDNSPLLHTVILKMTRPMDLILPWHQLAHLEIGGKWKMRLSDLSPALFQSRNLRTAILHSVPINRLPSEITKTTFPHLQVFKLRYKPYLNNHAHLATFLSLLRLPNLDTFEVCNLDSQMTQCQPIAFITMFPSPPDERRYLSLRRLSLVRTGPKMEQLLELLDRCPMLEELVLYLPLPPAQVLVSLTPSNSHSLPALAYLKSFRFGFERYGSDQDLQLIMDSFGILVCSWIMDPRRVNALSTVEFIGSEHGNFYGPVVELCEKVKVTIQKCCTEHGSYSSPIKALPPRIRYLSQIFRLWGMTNPTVQDWGKLDLVTRLYIEEQLFRQLGLKKILESQGEPRKIHLKDIDDIVQTLFRTNNQPTSSQRLVLKTFLGQTNSEIQSLKHVVKRLRLHINPGLNQIRDELFEKQQQANQCSRWLSAVRLLPPDVLIRIFEYSDGRDNLHSCTSILRLSHVCAPWRNAALMGRSLWNTLIVAVGDARPLYRKDASSLMRHWFDKAGPSQLLSIHLLLLPEYGETVASGLVAFAPRIQSLNLELKHVSYGNSLSDAFTTFLTLPGGQFSSLETLRFVEGSGFHGTVLPLINVFDNSPLLRNVILKMNRPTDLVLPWHQLVRLEIRGKVGIHLADLTPALSQSSESDELRKAAADAADLRRAAALLAAQQAAAAGEEERSRLQRQKEEEDRIRAQEEERARHLRQQDEMRLREEEIRRKKEARKMKEAEFVRRQRDADDTARAVRQAIEVNNPGTVSSPFLPLDNPAFMYDGDTTDSDSPQQSSRRPIEYPIRMPSRGGSLSYPPPVTTASLPPAEARITYPSLMTQHQQRQGYDPGRGMPLPTPQPHQHHRPPAVVMDSSPIRPHQPWIPDPRTRPPPRVPSPSAPQSQSQAQAQQPRVTETPITKPKTPRLTRDGLRQVNLPREALSRFATIAQMNTKKNLETCGLLLGKDRGHKYVVTTLLIPKQHATSDTCTMDEEELVMLFTEKRGLITLASGPDEIW